MRYVIYLRVSTDQQADAGHGLAIQEEACRAWLRRGRHKLAEVCVDAGRSGASDVGHRPGLARALALVAAGRAEGLLVYRLDRLARDVVLQEQLLAELHRRGNELHSCSPAEDEHLIDSPDDPTRALVRRILGAVAAHERDVIRLRLEAGRARKALAGGYVGGEPGYGWAAEYGELVRVDDEQRAIRQMMRLRSDGWSYRRIAAELERRGIRSRAAHGQWRPATIMQIVRREEAKKKPAAIAPAESREMEEVTA